MTRRVNIKRNVTLLSFTVTLLFALILTFPSKSMALPLPKTLIEEVRLDRDTKIINFHNLGDKAPDDARHLIVEIYTATKGAQADTVSVELTFNYGADGGYINRHLVGEADQLYTNLNSSARSAEILTLPVRQEAKFGSSRAFIPWAFLDNQSKHVLSQSGVGGDYASSSMAHWNSLEPIESIGLSLKDEYKFSEGSLIQVYAIDETYRIDEQVITQDSNRLDFNNLPQDKEGLIVIGQTRASEVNPLRRGDRVWYTANGDNNNSNYQVQRLTGEAPVYNLLNLGSDKLLLDQMQEPRVGWNTATEAPEGSFGPWLLHFSEYTNNDFWRSFMSLHGANDSHYDPVGNESGRWKSVDSIKDLSFYPQASDNFLAGSRIGIYSTKKSDIRYVVENKGETEVRLDLPASFDSAELQVNAKSIADGLEDELIIEFNDQSDANNYLNQTIWALDGDGGAYRENSNSLGVLPAKSYGERIYSSIYGSIRGLSSEVKTSTHAYGGVPAEGRVRSTAVESRDVERVSSVTFRTKSGEAFRPGSVFTVWVEDPYSNNAQGEGIISEFNPRAALLVLALVVGAIALSVSLYFRK